MIPASSVKVTAAPQFHSGESYGFRFERDGRSFVYSTDSEHKLEEPAETATFVEFFREPDIQIGYIAGHFTMGQILSVPMIIFGLVLIALAIIRNRQTAP